MIGPVKRLALLFVLALGVVAGCGDSGATHPAATVNGVEIPESQVVAELEAIAGNDDFRAQIESSSGTKVRGATDKSFDTKFVALVLSRQIGFELIGAEVDKRGLEVTDDVRQAALDDLHSQMGQGDSDKGKEVFAKFPQAYQDELVEWNAQLLVLEADLAGQPPLTEASEQAYYKAHTDEFEQVCAAHILVDSEDKANALKSQLDAGADFGTLAKDNSTDTGSGANGGDLGCVGKGTYVPEFEDAVFSAPVGEVVGPVQTQYGFHLIKVSERNTPPFDEIKDKVAQTISGTIDAAFSDYFQGAISGADVSVSDKYGTWNATTGQVDPPGSTTSTSTTVTTQ
jgi:parvulin-like peptidyl-prolyl isomerase